MDDVVKQMGSPAPQNVVDSLCFRLRLIAGAEGKGGEALSEECKSFLYNQAEVKWIDILTVSYLINGGIILRDVASPSPVKVQLSVAPVKAGTVAVPSSPVEDADLLEIEAMVNSLGVV